VTDGLGQTQRADGSWANPENLVKEDDPLIATAFAIRTLVASGIMVVSPAAPAVVLSPESEINTVFSVAAFADSIVWSISSVGTSNCHSDRRFVFRMR
jgi:hypothetical protein